MVNTTMVAVAKYLLLRSEQLIWTDYMFLEVITEAEEWE